MLVFRIARAYSTRPNSVRGWDYYEEFLPAAISLGEIPLVDELAKLVLDSFTKGGKSKRRSQPLNGKADRKRAFEALKEQRNNQDGNGK